MGPVTPIPEEKPEHEIGGPLDPAAFFAEPDWGFDTVAISYRPDNSRALAALRTPLSGRDRLFDDERGATVTDLHGDPVHLSVSAAGNWTMKLDFATVQGFVDAGFLRIEGRASALIKRDRGATDLVKPSDLSKVEGSALSLGWSVLGGEVFPVSRLQFRRWDLTVDFRNTTDPLVGRRTIAALAGVRLPYWGRADVHHARLREDIITGAAWPLTGRRQFRVYDKGFEQKHPRHRVRGDDGKLIENPRAEDPGRWLRLERQFRPTNPEGFKTREALEASNLRKAFLGRWSHLLGAPSISICAPTVAMARVAALFQAERIGLQTARRLLGEIAAASHSLDTRLFESHQALASELAPLGIVLAGDLPPSEQVEMKPLLEAAAECWPTKG